MPPSSSCRWCTTNCESWPPQKLAHEKPGQTLQATALVHEAYLRLVDGDQAQHWDSRGHFFAAAAEAMRRILVDNARKKQSLRRGGSAKRLPLEHLEPSADRARRESVGARRSTRVAWNSSTRQKPSW